jgi:hypothetical protein
MKGYVLLFSQYNFVLLFLVGQANVTHSTTQHRFIISPLKVSPPFFSAETPTPRNAIHMCRKNTHTVPPKISERGLYVVVVMFEIIQRNCVPPQNGVRMREVLTLSFSS